MSYPHWGREDVIADLIEEAVSSASGLLIEVVAPPEAGGPRFVETVVRGIDGNGISVHRVSAGEHDRLHPGRHAAAAGADGRRMLVIEHAHLADPRALATVAMQLVTDPQLTVLIERQPVDDVAARPFRQLAEIAGQTGGHRVVELQAPTVDDLATALDLERDAALALHKAAAGRDDRLVSLLDDLGHGDGAPRDLAQLLRDMTEKAAPLQGLAELARHVAELTSVALEPLAADVVATAVGSSEREVLEAMESLIDAGIVEDTPNGITAAATRSAQAVADSLSHARVRAAHRAIADALADRPGHDRAAAHHLEHAGAWQQAFDRWAAIAETTRGADDAAAGEAVERALRALAQGATTQPQQHGRLLLARALVLSSAAYSDLALADLRAAVPLLTGDERIDALGSLASVLDNQQLPQEAEVTIATAEWEARTQGAHHKVGSLLTFRGRTIARLGFADEADRAVERGLELIGLHGTPRQQRNARTNRAWLAFDRGEATRAEQLFDELLADTADGGDVLAERAWHGRALALRGLAGRARQEFEQVESVGDDPAATAAQFLTAIGRQELAVRFGRADEALAANVVERALVTLFLPAWENGTWHRRAEALLAKGDLDGAAEAAAQALERSPAGANGLRWRLRTEALVMKIEQRRSGAWPKAAAENLTDVLLHAGWYGAAVDLMVTRAAVDGDDELASDAADLALRLGDPILAAAALDAGGDASRQAVGRAVQAVAKDVPDDWRAAWEAQPGIAAALSVEVSDDAVEPDWHADLRSWLDESDLAERRLSPAQRQTGGLVRRSREPRRWGLTLLASTIAAALAATLVLALAGLGPWEVDTTTTVAGNASAGATTATTAAPTTTTTTTIMEQNPVEIPESGLFGAVEYLGGPSRNNLLDTTAIRDFTGYYWRYSAVQTVRSQPVVQGRLLYVGDREGVVHVINLDTGTAERRFEMVDDISAPLAVGRFPIGEGGRELTRGYAVDVSGDVMMFDASDELTAERYPLGARVDAGPIIVGEPGEIPTSIVFATSDGRVRALNTDVTAELAVFPPESEPPLGPIRHTPAYHDGKLFIADGSGVLTVLDAASLEMVCTRELRGAASGSPVIADDRVWVPASTAIEIYQLDCRPPPETELQQIPGAGDTSPVIDLPLAFTTGGSVALLENLTQQMNILDRQSGAEWFAQARGLIESSLVVSGGVVYFGDNDSVVALDAQTGIELDRFSVGSAVRLPLIVIENAVIVTTDEEIVAIAGTP